MGGPNTKVVNGSFFSSFPYCCFHHHHQTHHHHCFCSYFSSPKHRYFEDRTLGPLLWFRLIIQLQVLASQMVPVYPLYVLLMEKAVEDDPCPWDAVLTWETGKSSWLLALDQLSSRHCSHLGSTPANAKSFLLSSLSFLLFANVSNKNNFNIFIIISAFIGRTDL